MRVFARAQLEGVEAAALEKKQVIARNVAHRAQLALVAVALAQQPADREAAAVAELREMHLHPRHARQASGHRRRVVARLETQHFALLRRRRAVADYATAFDQP